ncbi:MAG: M20/M25/M40 family metallo-hydrolase [Bryobacteraceae bacterium]
MRALALLLLAARVWAADLAAGLNSINMRNVRADVEFLASGALEGRLSLRRGADAAAEFVAAEFLKAGLQPAAGHSFLQAVPLVEYRVDRGLTTLTVNGKARRYGSEFSTSFAMETTVSGPVVFAGYGITAPEFRYDDYAGLDARGKIVLVFDHEPQENNPDSVFNGRGNTRYASTLVKLWNAEKHGALAVLVAAEPGRNHPTVQERMARVPGGAVRARTLAPQALAEPLARIPSVTIADSVLNDLLAGTGQTAAALQKSIDAALKPASMALPGSSLRLNIALAERRRADSFNVVGMLEGSHPQLKNESVLFTAHYDHDGAWDGEIRPGADDNASGTAGIIELARAYARNKERPRRTLVFVATAAEERGLLGAYAYTQHPPRPLAATRAVINFDMIGRNEAPSKQTEGLVEVSADTSNELNLIGTIDYPEYRKLVEKENREIGLRLNYKFDADAALNVIQRSDQFPFMLHKVPAVWWFTGFHPEYHQVSDSAEKLNYVKMEKILKLAYLTGWRFADE